MMPKSLLQPGRAIVLLLALSLLCTANTFSQKMTEAHLTKDEQEQRIDVWFDDELFTSFHYDGAGEKPVLYPIVSAGGKKITRHHTADPMAGERVDHPHHIGLWLNYGDVNNIDFWNNSRQKAAKNPSKFGWIKVTEKPKLKKNELTYTADWQTHQGDVLLKEKTTLIFRQTASNSREIIRTTTLTARTTVNLNDNKEGLLGLRLTRALEHPTEKPVLLSKSDGTPREEAVLDNTNVTGRYTSPEGPTGSDVWGTRAPWMSLSGIVSGENINVTIFDHPDNPGYPTYWHARAYGLFAANPLGQKVFSKGDQSLDLSLETDESVTFTYMVQIENSAPLNQPNLKMQAELFAKEF